MEIVNSEKFNRELRIDYDAKLKERDIEILNLKQYMVELKNNSPETNYEIENEETSFKIKYSTSTLNDDCKELLLTSINDIMENTKEFCNPDFSLEKLALIVNSKSKYVSQVINETYGKNFSMFVNEQRVKQARKLLSDRDYYENYTIESISEKVGFKSRANFNVIFKKITGITPSLYMEMMKKDKI